MIGYRVKQQHALNRAESLAAFAVFCAKQTDRIRRRFYDQVRRQQQRDEESWGYNARLRHEMEITWYGNCAGMYLHKKRITTS